MKRLISLTVAAIAMVLLAGAALAGDTKVIDISVTIPAIPGVNVPPYSLDDTNGRMQGGIEENDKKEKKAKDYEAPLFIVQDEKERKSENERFQVAVKSLYSR